MNLKSGQFPTYKSLFPVLRTQAASAVIPWDEAAADHYGQIRTAMEKAGTPIGSMDMMIAVHARSQGATLVSNNTRDLCITI